MKPQQILDLEKQLGFELKEAENYDGLIYTSTYLLNDQKEVIGLTFPSNQNIDIHYLKEFVNLERLNLMGKKITDLSILQSFTKLKYLDLQLNPIQDFSPLKSLQNLTEFYANEGIVDNDFSFVTNTLVPCIVLRFENKIVWEDWTDNQIKQGKEPSLENFRKFVEKEYGKKANVFCPKLWEFLKQN